MEKDADNPLEPNLNNELDIDAGPESQPVFTMSNVKLFGFFKNKLTNKNPIIASIGSPLSNEQKHKVTTMLFMFYVMDSQLQIHLNVTDELAGNC